MAVFCDFFCFSRMDGPGHHWPLEKLKYLVLTATG